MTVQPEVISSSSYCRGRRFTTIESIQRWNIVTVQDESSSLVAQVGDLHPGDKVLDTCAAPGGKTTHFASYLVAKEGGLVEALDLHENKLRKIHQNAKRLGVEDRIHTHALDARKVGRAV